jgi:alpha-beta hydrolase superfamily lysophospholipase
MNALSSIAAAHPAAGLPVRFGQIAGIFTQAMPLAAPSSTAVLLVSPWGFEDMSVRSFYRRICEELAHQGIANLRFDLPGCGDSVEASPTLSLDDWLDRIAEASRKLQAFSGATKVVLVGHGLGATLALLAETRIENLAGLALLGPVVSGRTYARETALWWKMIAADLGLGPDHTETSALTIAGMTMPENVAGAIRKIRETDLKLTRALPVLAVCRKGRDSDDALASALEAGGAHVTRMPYEGFDALVVNPLISRVPESVVVQVCQWVRAMAPAERPAAIPASAADIALVGDGYREIGIRFGQDGGLAGTFCEPSGTRHGAPVVLVSTSYDRASGWAGGGARIARELARRGIVSLRFDPAGVADSPPKPGDPRQVLYSQSINRDVKAAVEELTQLSGQAPVLAGRCSGGYHGFRTSVAQSAIAGVAVINSYAFVWDERKDVDDALTAVARPLGDYSKRAMNPETFRRVLRGEVNLKSAVWNIGTQIAARVINRIEPLLGSLSQGNRLKAQIVADFATLRDRNVPITLAYGDTDPGLEQSRMVFGADLSGLKRFPNARFVSLGRSDHNVTVAAAQRTVIDEIARLALETAPACKLR